MKILQVPTTQIGLGFKPYQNQAGRYVQRVGYQTNTWYEPPLSFGLVALEA